VQPHQVHSKAADHHHQREQKHAEHSDVAVFFAEHLCNARIDRRLEWQSHNQSPGRQNTKAKHGQIMSSFKQSDPFEAKLWHR
jgi:hypothetical protein